MDVNADGARTASIARAIPFAPDNLSFAGMSYTAVPLPPGEGKNVLTPQGEEDPKPRRIFHYSIRLGGRLFYSDNINGARVDPLDDLVLSLEPGFSIGLGDVPERKESYIRLDYSPNALLFAEHSEFNALQHFIHLEALARLGRLSLTLTQDVQLLDGTGFDFENPNNFGAPRDPNAGRHRDVAGRNEFELYATALGARYDLSDKASLDSGLNYTRTTYIGLFTTEVYSGFLFFDYKLTPQLKIGAGGAGGAVEFDDPIVEERFQEVRGRLTFEIPKKVLVNASAGVEFRQFGPMGRANYSAPIAEFTTAYEPVEGTKLTLNGRHRSFVSNALLGQSFRVTGFSGGVEQRLTDRLGFRVFTGYETADYFSTLRDIEAEREDQFFFVDVSLEVKITRIWSAGVFYIHRDLDSNLMPFGFVENQVGVRTGVAF